ncbi:MAG: ImmA/IrrE family metallo-endopeptidase [Candidatus Acidiferrales bacterium]
MRSSRSGFYRRKDGTERIWLQPADIEAIAEDSLLKLGLFPTEELPAVDIERVVQGLGVRMDQYADLDSSVLGQTEFYADAPPRIFINRDLSGAIDEDQTPPGIRGRWRATIAHEAVHVMIHRVLFDVNQDQGSFFRVEKPSEPRRLMRCLKKNVLFRGGGGSDWREVQANMGMAALLMPQGLFRHLSGKVVAHHALATETLCVGTVESAALTTEMAALFDVSKQAAGIRLQTLQILSPLGQHRLLHATP